MSSPPRHSDRMQYPRISVTIEEPSPFQAPAGAYSAAPALELWPPRCVFEEPTRQLPLHDLAIIHHMQYKHWGAHHI